MVDQGLIRQIASLDELLAEKLIEANGCLNYGGYRNADGYGRVNRGGKALAAHRYLWILMFGQIAPGLVVCHRCDNPACCNPDHLFVGTQADNVADMISKGRDYHPPLTNPYRSYGEENNKAKLTEEQVRWIKANHKPGRMSPTGCPQIAKLFGVDRNTVLAIVTGKTWKEVA